jgi:glycosyltransferase 2 family protein
MDKRTWIYLWRLSFSLLLLFLLLRLVRFEEALQMFKKMNGAALTGYLVTLFGDRLVMAYKWKFLLEPKGIFLSWKELAAVYFKGTLIGNLLPTSLGGDIIRAYELAKNDSALKDVVASIAMERVLGFLSSALMALMVLPWLSLLGPDIPRPLIWALIVFLLGGVVLFFLFMAKVDSPGFKAILQKLPASKKLLGLASSWSLYKNYPRALWRFFFWSFGEQLLPILGTYLLALSLGLSLPLYVYLAVIPITQFFARIPISLSGFGIQEGLFMAFFSFFGLASTSAFTLGFASNLGNIISGLPGVFFYLRKKRSPGFQR